MQSNGPLPQVLRRASAVCWMRELSSQPGWNSELYFEGAAGGPGVWMKFLRRSEGESGDSCSCREGLQKERGCPGWALCQFGESERFRVWFWGFL